MPGDHSIEFDRTFGCRLWTGKLDKDGYPLTINGRRAHRVLYEEERGPIAKGKELEHTCRNRRCVAWYHLEPVTRSVNEQRKSWSNRVRLISCPVGHELNARTAMVTPAGGRVCRTCRDQHAG